MRPEDIIKKEKKEIERALKQMHPDNLIATQLREKYRELEKKEKSVKD